MSDLTQQKLQRTVEAVEAPYGRRYERELRDIYEDDSVESAEKSRQLVDKISELGLQPYEAPDPLPRIEENKIKLICWMIIAPNENTNENHSQLRSQVTFGDK